MKILRISIVFALALLLIMPLFVFAINEVTLTADTFFSIDTIDTAAPVTVVGKSGGVASQLVIDTNFIDVTIDNGTSFTFEVPSGFYFNLTKQSGSNDYNFSPGCIQNAVTVTGSGATTVLRLEVDTTAPLCAIGGGGEGPLQIYPTNTLITINNGASCTPEPSVLLRLDANSATEVLISNNKNFTGNNFIPFISSLTTEWTLSDGDGEKTVYALFKSETGNFSNGIEVSIELDQSTRCGQITEPKPKLEEKPEPKVSPSPKLTPQVIFYKDINYGGLFETLNADDPDLRNNIIQNDSISSIRFFNGATATVFEDINFGGRSEIFTQDDSDLRDNFIGQDSISSIKVNIHEEEVVPPGLVLKPGDLIKDGATTVYYYGSDKKRHSFPNIETYTSWYGDFSTIKSVPESILSVIPLGSNVTYRPGVKMIKLKTNSRVYAIDNGGVLRWIETGEVAESLYGSQWETLVDDLNDAFFADYFIGPSISSPSQFNPIEVTGRATTIDEDKSI